MKLIYAIVLSATIAGPAVAQSGPTAHAGHGEHAQHAQLNRPVEPGEAAFGAIAEIVALLMADPKTDWTRVNIDSLRQHLLDMHLVTISASVQVVETPKGWSFIVTGNGETAAAIQRMTLAHAPFLEAEAEWDVSAREIDGGAELTVSSADPALRLKTKALGYFGLMALGEHHVDHHVAMARGEMAHHH